MKIAIVGAGFSGLATAWHLLNSSSKKISVVIFDSIGIGGGASGIAAGLLHPFSGAHAKLNWQGLAGMKATQQLLDVAAKTLQMPVATYSGILRIAVSEEQNQDFAHCAQKYQETKWLSVSECQKIFPHLIQKPGILINDGITVNSSLYLQGLWKACEDRGALFKQQTISQLSELDHFDAIVIAAGYASKNISEVSSLPLTPVKGQILELKWPSGIIELPLPINSYTYIIPSYEKHTCIVGATYERDFIDEEPNREVAKKELLTKTEQILPLLENASIIDCRAGIRASTPDHRPIAKRINEKCWVLTGMGSKGLLYHALFAEHLAKEILKAKV